MKQTKITRNKNKSMYGTRIRHGPGTKCNANTRQRNYQKLGFK